MNEYVIQAPLTRDREIEPVMTSTKLLDEHYKLLIELSGRVFTIGLVSKEEFDELDALIQWLGEINDRLPDDGIVILEMSE